jgi:glyoxylase-like metal-dependent hydrolase (beta-lactamase superfamily II)
MVTAATIEVHDVAPGLWLWRRRHPEWFPRAGWEPEVSSFCVTSRGTTLVLDALDPGDEGVWKRLDAARPTAVVVVKPDHFRSAELFARRYGATLYSEAYVGSDKGHGQPFEQTAPGMELPGGLLTLEDGRWRQETPVFLPEQQALVFADGLLSDSGGILRVWETPWHERRVLPALRAMLELPLELVLVSHGEPVHSREEFEAALRRPPYTS